MIIFLTFYFIVLPVTGSIIAGHYNRKEARDQRIRSRWNQIMKEGGFKIWTI